MSLVLWLPLNGNLNNQGLSNVKSTSANYTVQADGKIGSCIKTTSDGNIDTLLTSDKWDYKNGSISFGGWFKFNKDEIENIVKAGTYSSTASTPTGCLLGKYSYGGCGLTWVGNNYYTSSAFTSMTVFAHIRIGTITYQPTGQVVTFDKWTHYFITYDKTTNLLSFYVDGNLISTKTVGEFDSGNYYGNFFINDKKVYGGNGPAFNIPFGLNDVRVYDHCLSVKEVKEIAKGLVLHYKLDGNNFGDTNKELDCSGFNNNGIKSGTHETDINSGRYSSCSKFNGSNSIITTNTFSEESCKTVSFWLKVATKPTDSRVVFADKGSAMALGFFNGSSFIVKANTSQVTYPMSSLKIGEWNHIVLVKNSIIEVYINSKKLTANTSTNYWTHSTQTLEIGARSTGSYFNGFLSDFRVYATILSDNDIKELYNVKASIDKKGNLFCGEVVEE